MFGPYLRVLRTPGTVLPLLAAFAGALPIGILGLAVLLLARTATGSFAEAGALAGALNAGNAAGLAVQGRLIDRRGQAPVLVPAGLLCAAALVLLVAALTQHAPAPAATLLALIAGGSIPPTTSSMRVLWPRLLPDGDAGARAAAYALLAVAFTLATVVGPLIVSGLLLVTGPAAAVLAAAGLAAVAAVLFAATPASRRWRPTATPRRRQGRASATPGMRTVLVANLGSGLTGGLVAVGVPAVAVAHGAAALTGVLFALASAGYLGGGLLYGGASRRLPVEWQLPLLQAASVAVVGSMGVVGQPEELAALMLAGGALRGPTSIAMSALLDLVAAPDGLTQAYTLLVATYLVGVSAGSALGGLAAGASGGRAPLLAGAYVMAVVTGWTLARRRTLTRR